MAIPTQLFNFLSRWVVRASLQNSGPFGIITSGLPLLTTKVWESHQVFGYIYYVHSLARGCFVKHLSRNEAAQKNATKFILMTVINLVTTITAAKLWIFQSTSLNWINMFFSPESTSLMMGADWLLTSEVWQSF